MLQNIKSEFFSVNSIVDFKKSDTSNDRRFDRFINITIFFSWLISVASLFAPIFLLSFFVRKAGVSKDQDQIIIFFIFFINVFVANWAYAYLQEVEEKNKYWAPLLPILAVIISLMIVKKPIIPKLVMHNFQLGSFKVNRLILDETGCQILNNFELAPKPEKNEFIHQPKGCVLENVLILSRLGREFRLEQEINKDETVIFNIPKQHVLSWSVTKPRPKEKKSDTKLK